MANPNTNTQYTGGFHDDPLNSGRGTLFGNSIGGFLDDAVGGILFGDPDWSSEIMGELLGYNSQQREFAMQEYMTDKQNRWNSAQEQMKRAKEAGINPLTAAGGIAGNGSSSAAAPEPSAAGAAAGGLNAITGAIGTLSNLRVDAAKAESDKANANKTNAETPYVPLLAHGQNMKYFGDFVTSMKDVGIAEIQSGGIAFDMMNGGLQKALDYLSLCSGLRNVDKQMKLIENEYQLGLKDLESYDVRLNSNLSLQEKQGLKAAADAAKAKLEGTYLQKKIDLEKSLPGITLLQGGNLATHLAWKYGVDSPEFKAFENGVYNYAYQSQLGSNEADVDTAFESAYNSGLATHQLAIEYGYSEARIEVIKEAIKDYSKFLLSNGGGISGIESAIGKLLNAVLIPTAKGDFNMNDVLGAKRPFIEPKRSLHYHQSTVK